ncbi:MAG TPA: GNAT family N-acetyltransferase [Fimbriimonadales bacterium]|nr:GNAT family N-acetyltransferase [Fimbriimonadales bacterium]
MTTSYTHTLVRTIRREEVDTFLRLLCDVFDLDFHHAKVVFTKEPFFDLERKWAIFFEGKMIGCLTTVPVQFGDGRAIGIAGVAVREEYRGQGFGSELMRAVLRESDARGEGRALLFAQEPRFYEKHGFRVLDDVISGEIIGMGNVEGNRVLPIQTVRKIYDAWASESPIRLRRDSRRWDFWSWSGKVPYEMGEDGYVCMEGMRIRELLPKFQPFGSKKRISLWNDEKRREWYGLKTMVEKLEIPIGNYSVDLKLMGLGFNEVPEMFLSDQF